MQKIVKCILGVIIIEFDECGFFLQQVVSDSMMAELKECFMEAYDDNKDGKIEIREVCAVISKSGRKLISIGIYNVTLLKQYSWKCY